MTAVLTAVTVRDYYGDASEEEIKAAAPSPTPTPEENTPPRGNYGGAYPYPGADY